MRYSLFWTAMAAVSACAMARAQSPERATFYILAGQDTLARERITRGASSADGEFLSAAAGARLTYHLDLAPGGLVTRMRLSQINGADTVAHAAVVIFRGDSVSLESGDHTTALFAGAGAMPNFNPSAALFEQMLIRARLSGDSMITIPAFYPGARQTVPTTIAFVGADSALITVNGVHIHVAVSPAGLLLGGVVPEQHVRFVRAPWVAAFSTTPPDYSAPPGAPYTAEEVVVHTPAGVTLVGTLTRPAVARAQRVPAVVLITGSGQEDRDEDLPGVEGYHPFRQIADTLGRRGIAVLRLDDRGVGGSSGPVETATSADFADDIRAAILFLRARGDIDGARIGLLGHSEGGMIAPMVAANDPGVRALVLLAGPAWIGRRILQYQREFAVDSMLRVPAARRDSVLGVMEKALDSTAAANAWIRFFLDYDPLATARRVRAPVLILQGATDRQVTPQQAEELARAFRAGGDRDVTVRVFAETNHLFLHDASGNPTGYSTLPARRISTEILGVIADWCAQKLDR